MISLYWFDHIILMGCCFVGRLHLQINLDCDFTNQAQATLMQCYDFFDSGKVAGTNVSLSTKK